MTDPTPKRQAPRWMKITLVMSLAANMAVIGIIAGFAMRGPMWQPHRDGMAELLRGMPPEHLREMRSELFGHRDNLREGLRGQRELTSDLATTLRATPFNPDAFADVLARQRGRLSEIQLISHNALVARVTGMSDEERARYAEALSRGRYGDEDDE